MSNARGIRNNNPGNIRKDGSVWRGEVAGPDKSFKTFETMAWGIRAIYHLLNNYRLLYGCDTIEKMIRAVGASRRRERYGELHFHGVEPFRVPRTSRLTTTDRSVMEPIVRAMLRVETGMDVSAADYNQAWERFLKHKNEKYFDRNCSTGRCIPAGALDKEFRPG